MSQEQPRRPEPVRYGDVLLVSGELAPGGAAAMQEAETMVLGQTRKDGPAAFMQSAADFNENRGVVSDDDMTDIASDQGVRVAEGYVSGRRDISESVVDVEIVGGSASRGRPGGQVRSPSAAIPGGDAITIGEALEATAFVAGNKPVDQSDAAAIQAAEVRATGRGQVMHGGIGAEAQSAADLNTRTMRDDDKTKLVNVLGDATVRLPDDKQVTREDAERVVAAEARNDPGNHPYPGGVAASLAAAARLNQGEE